MKTPIAEEELIATHALARRKVRSFREANAHQEGRWFVVTTAPRGIGWLEPGMAALVEHFALERAPEKNAAPAAEGRVARMLVARGGGDRHPLKNSRLVYAYREGADPDSELDRVYVRVRDNRNFRRDARSGGAMVIPVLLTGTNSGELPSDQRLPRRPGEWGDGEPRTLPNDLSSATGLGNNQSKAK